MSKMLDEARRKLKDSVFSYKDVVKETETVVLSTNGGDIEIPLNCLGWDYKTLPGLKLMPKHGKEMDVIFIIALSDSYIPKHQISGYAYYNVSEGFVKDMYKGLVIKPLSNYEVKPNEWHEIFIKKDSVLTITFKPKLNYE